MRQNGGDANVDIDQLNFDQDYKVKSADASAQTLHLLPYRLRFLPTTICDVKLDPSEKSCIPRCKNFFRIVCQCILSLVGLFIVVVIWALLGALTFYKSEGPRVLRQSKTLAEIQRNLASELATDLSSKGEHQYTWPDTIHKYLEKHETLFLDAVGAGYGEGGGGNIWTYPGCILFAVSLLTTLGFGSPVPRTPLGRGMAVIFATIGIPLHFLLILNVGNLLANKLQQFAHRKYISEVPSAPRPTWLKLFPILSIIFYYMLATGSADMNINTDTLSIMLPDISVTCPEEVFSKKDVFFKIGVDKVQKLASLAENLLVTKEADSTEEIKKNAKRILKVGKEKLDFINNLAFRKKSCEDIEKENIKLEEQLDVLESNMSLIVDEEKKTQQLYQRKREAFETAISEYSSVFDFTVTIVNESDSMYEAEVKFHIIKAAYPIKFKVDRKLRQIICVALFGFVRKRDVLDCFMFPLDFTVAGGVANVSGQVRIFYALYLELAVILASTIVSLLQACATRGIVEMGLRIGVLTNT